jgi:DNA ligase-associated metallophosphoesterase
VRQSSALRATLSDISLEENRTPGPPPGDRGSPPSRIAPSRGGEPLSIADAGLIADCAGALYWPDEGLLAVSDLHLEKGSSFAERGVLLPPYDTAETLVRLAELVLYYSPRVVVALGDNFHDGRGPRRVSACDLGALGSLQRGRDWIWITGNHDPEPADGIGGVFTDAFAVGALVFRHIPTAAAAAGEIAGHLHPVARVNGRAGAVRRRCFVSDGRRLVMPAFGAYAGGLNIRHAAFVNVFGTMSFEAHVLGHSRVYTVGTHQCVAD